MTTQKPTNFLALCAITATLFLSIFAAPQLRAAVVNVRLIGPYLTQASHDSTAIAAELNSILAGASGYTGSTAAATVLDGNTLTEAYYHPTYRTSTRAALALSYTHLVILPETAWLNSYPEMTFDGVYQMSRKAFAQGATPMLLMPGTGTSGNVTILGTNAYRIGNGCGIHTIPGGYAAQSASLLDPSTTNNQARQAYLLAATIFTKITGLNATTGSTYVPTVSSPSTLATTAVTTINTHNSTVHYSTSRENSGLIRYRPITPPGNVVRYAWTGTSTETGINGVMPAILQASGYTVYPYQVTSTRGWSDAITASAQTNFNTYPNQYQFVYARDVSGELTATGSSVQGTNQTNILPISHDQHYTGLSLNAALDDIYWLSETARSQCTTYGWATVPVHLSVGRLNDLDPSIIVNDDSLHWSTPVDIMIATMMSTSALGRDLSPTAAILANSQWLNGFNMGKQAIRQLAFLSETEAYTPDTALAISEVPAMQAVQNQAFSYSFTATGGTAPYTWTEESTTGLPAGLTLAPNGNLNGLATAGAGTWNLILQVKDSNGAIRKVCATLTVALTGSGPGTLSMTSGAGLSASGSFGGPFSPSSVQYTLSNIGTTSINWTATKTQSWLTPSPASGTLAAGANTTVTVSLNTAANSLAANNYSDTVTFTNTTNNAGNTTRSVALTVFATAANLTWDANGTTSTQTDGVGEWTTASQWWNGSANVTWAAGSNALFGNGGTGGAVTLASPKTANALTFNSFSGTYTLGSTGQTLTLNGGITVNATSGTVTLASPVALGGAQAWTNNSTNPLTASNAISGSGNLTKEGTGTLVLAPNPDFSNYTGATVVSSGVLNIQKPTALGSVASGTSVAVGGALQIQGGISIGAEPLTLEGSGISNTGALRNISGTNLYDGLLSLTGATLINSDAGSLVLTNAGTITGAGAALTLGGAGSTTIFSIIGTTSGSLTKEGAGTLTLCGASTYSGGTVINAGNITLGTTAIDSLGAAASNVTANTSTTLTTNGTTTLQKSFTLNNNAILNLANASGGVTITGAITGTGGIRPIGGATGLGQRMTTLSSTANDFNGPISNPVGANFADLVVNSLYDGVGAGNITLGEAGQGRTMRVQLGGGANAPLTISNRQIAIVGTTTWANLSNSATAAANFLTVTNNLLNSNTGAATLELGGSNTGSNRFGGNITNGSGGGTLALTKSGGGTWALSGINTYSGITTNAFSNPSGVLIFQGMQSLPTSTTFQQTFSGGTGSFATIKLLDDSATPLARSGVNLNLLGTGASQGMTLFVGNNSTTNGGTSSSTQTGSTIALGNLNFDQGGTSNTSQKLHASGSNGYRLQINNVTPTLQATATTWTAVLNPTSAPLTVAGKVQQAGNGSAGTTTLNLDGTATDNLIGGMISNSADASPKAMSLTKSNTSSWILTGVNTYTGATTISAGTLQLGTGTSGKDGTIETTSSITNNGTLVFNRFGNLSSNVAISGTGAVTKTGPGSQTLTGTLSYAGLTTITNGKLFIDGSLSNLAIGLTINNGATLGGIGTIGRNVTIAAGGKLEFNLSTPPASHDRLDISAGRSFGFSGASELTITSPGGTERGSYTLLTGGNNLTGVAPAIVNLPAGWVATVSMSGNSLLLNVTAVPGTSVGNLTLNPAGGLSSSGSVGGPFSPTSLVYTLANPGASSVNWTASKAAGWVTLSATSGTLAAGTNTSVTVSLNSAADALAVGSYNDTVTFSDTTNGGNTTRSVALSVNPGPYTVSYDGNANTGGTAPSSQLKTHNVGLTLSGAGTLVRSGYTFSGWNTAANGSGGTAYAAGASYTANAATTLYAQWVDSLTWDANGSGVDQTNGTGAWLGANLWWNGVSNQSWTHGSHAVFGGPNTAGGAVSLASPTSVNSITFNTFTGTYTLGTAGQTLTIQSGITNNSAAGAVTLSSPITLSAPQTWTNHSSGLLTGTATVDNGGNLLTIDGTGNITMPAASTIIGAGGLIKNGTGTLILLGNNTYTGTTTVSAGTLSIGDGTTNGTPSGAYQIDSPGTLRIRYNSSGIVTALWTATLWNNFTGSGILALKTAKSADTWGTAALPNTFTGTLQIESGRVVTSSATGAGFGGATAINVQSGGQLTDYRGSTITQNLTIAGIGYGEGGLECAVRMGDGQASTLSGLVALSASATIGARATGILTNVVSGDAGYRLTIGTSYSNGTIILAANNTYLGPTTIAYGILQIGNGGGTGSLGAGAVTNNGKLVFNRTGTVNVGQAITGSGAVKQIGSGTVTLAAANSYGGATTLTAGKLVLGRNGALPTGSAVSIGNATLDAGTYAHTAGTLGITGVASIAFGSGATLAFTDSSAQIWIGALELTGNFVSGVSLRFGTTGSGLTAAQLERIHATGFTGFALNSQGYLTATPVAVYSAWQAANTTTQTVSEDLDGDGVPNGLEYFLHGNTNSSGVDVLPGVTGSVGNLSVTWTKAATYTGSYGTDFIVQTSPSLAAGSWTNEPLGTHVIITGNDVKYNFPAGTQGFARLVVGEIPAAPLVVDTSNAIPLRDHIYRKDQFALSLRGSAIKGLTPFEVNFDTGSLQTCLPYGALNKANLTVVQSNVRTVWGRLSDQVTGQLVLKSRDGLTDYTLDDFTFYAMKNEDGSDMPDDRTSQWSYSICGAGPFDNSIVAALMAKYSTNGLGAGIISESPGGDLTTNWSSHKSYLKFGNDPAVASRLNWYYWSPWYTGQPNFDAITIPGFKFTYSFPAVSGQTTPDLVVDNQIATIDSGAPEFVMRMGAGDPHRQLPYSQFFNITNVPSWYSSADCLAVNAGVTLNVQFTGSTGKTNSYSFQFSDHKNNPAYAPSVAFIGNWASNIPWAPNTTTMPMNRMNLGNSIYFFAKVYFWDYTNQRVGFYFN